MIRCKEVDRGPGSLRIGDLGTGGRRPEHGR